MTRDETLRDLPERVVVDQHGHYWRDYETHLSMPPVSEETAGPDLRDKALDAYDAWSRYFNADQRGDLLWARLAQAMDELGAALHPERAAELNEEG